MIMIGEVDKLNCSFGDFADGLKNLGNQLNLKISAMHEDIFNSMHRI